MKTDALPLSQGLGFFYGLWVMFEESRVKGLGAFLIKRVASWLM